MQGPVLPRNPAPAFISYPPTASIMLLCTKEDQLDKDTFNASLAPDARLDADVGGCPAWL